MAFSMITPPKLMDYYEIAPGGDVTLVLHVPLEPLPTELDMVVDEGLGEEVEKVRTIRVRVFSQHLILASPVFKAMLQGPFSEAQALRTEGHTTISLPEDNAEAMILILNVIHHQNRSVTTFISRELMVQICILVDKYTFDQCLHFVSKEWIKNLRLSDKVPSSFCPALMEWILIAWVFDLNDIFISATSIAMSTASRPIDESDVMGLPIPSSIIDRMNMRREEAIRSHYANFCRFLDRYQETRHHGPSQEAKTLCQHKNEICDFYYLGCLFQHAILQKAYPPPEPPYTGQSQENIRTELCTNIWEESSGGFHQECGMETRKLLLEEIGNAPTALSIRDFKRGSFGFLGLRKLSRS